MAEPEEGSREEEAKRETPPEETAEKKEAERRTEEAVEPKKKVTKGEAKEAKAAKRKEKDVEEEEEEERKKDVVEEKIYTIPLGRAWITQRPYRTPKSVKLLRDYIKRHMKTDAIKLQGGLNRFLWQRGIEKPPRRVRVRATKDKDGTVRVYLAEGRE